jgi:hypothetical protein
MTTARTHSWILVAAGVAYVFVPGAPHVPVSGIPIGQSGIAALVLLIGGWWWARRHLDTVATAAVVALTLLVGVKIAIGWWAPQPGWRAQYYANESFAPPLERSIDFRGLDATRIDRRISFVETEFPVHFFNNAGYNTGVFREWTLPFSVQWIGHIASATPARVPIRLVANGRAEVRVDGVRVASVEGRQQASADAILALEPGEHRIEVQYQKPADTQALIHLLRVDGDRTAPAFEDAVSPFAATGSLDRLLYARAAGWAFHLAALLIVVTSLWPGWRARGLRPLPLEPAIVILLTVQGLWKARHLVDRVWTMSGGDDWLNYEMSARDVVLNGLIMSQGGVIGNGQPFSLYPGYAYFVALVHAVAGESLAGVVLMNFVLLAIATLVAHRIARHLVGPLAAFAGVIWLLLIEQADFVRYYTVTLFSENLYFVLAAATVLLLIRHYKGGGTIDLAAAAVAGALASWTRPSMMLLLPLAVVGIVLSRWRPDRLMRTAFQSVLFVAVWMACIAPITIRNYIMSGRAVLLTAGQGASFVAYNMPVDDPAYFKGFDGTLFHSAIILVRMFVDHPIISMRNYGTKLGFSLGMVHWMGSGTMHPELVATSLLYFVGLVLLKPLRSIAAWPLHVFVLTHVATLMLTMPSNYGYRMILPAFVFMALVAGAVAFTPVIRLAMARRPALVPLVDEASR